MDRRFAAAIAKADLRPAEGDVEPGRTLMDTSGALMMVGPEHALDGATTLCGLSKDDVVVMRHLWSTFNAHGCEVCKDAFYGISPTPDDEDLSR